MNCGDYERLWNERLDARGAATAATEQALEGHAAACPACRALGARYQALAQAIGALSLAPPPPLAPDFADRVLAAAAEARAERPALRLVRPARWLTGLAAAAALVVAVGLGWRGHRLGPGGALRVLLRRVGLGVGPPAFPLVVADE